MFDAGLWCRPISLDGHAAERADSWAVEETDAIAVGIPRLYTQVQHLQRLYRADGGDVSGDSVHIIPAHE